ncbi:MAG: glutamate--tRNA ligase [Planctomycetes bacterium]|nr:glutamate--tRNA ligase [Planctomycetota bacterium]
MDKVRVRFAPSPTGYLHIGGARTALYNYLFARHLNGTLVLRIEDTDHVRSTDESTKAIFESLNWLGITHDEGPYYQSERRDLYKQYAQKLLDEGKAVYQDDPAKGRAVVFKMPEGKSIRMDDLIHGVIKFESKFVGDIVLIKSDGFPTYNFACVIDDSEMGITHVIRGDDHISNTPKQIALYEALGKPVPKFAHIPLIMGEDGSRLSKRHGHTSVGEYKDLGYLPEAVFNFLSLLGWSPGDDTEIMTKDEIIKRFTIERVKDKSAQFNLKKLTWMNSHYIKHKPAEDLFGLAEPYLTKAGYDLSRFPKEKLVRLVDLYRERIKVVSEIAGITRFFFEDAVNYQPEAVDKFIKTTEGKAVLGAVQDELAKITKLEHEPLENLLRSIAESKGLKFQGVAQPLRVALTGSSVSPPIFETMELIGLEKVKGRIKEAIALK